MTNVDEPDLDRLLSDLGTTNRPVPETLMARILQDAAAVQQDRQRPSPAFVAPRPSLWRRMSAAVGGGRVLAGLGSAAAAGIAFGLAQPDPVAALAPDVWGQSLDISVDLWPMADDVLAEG